MNKKKEKVLSLTKKDFEIQHFRAGGKGGQKQNSTDSGSRVIHHPSGARGESREHRQQAQNTKAAFQRMAETRLFKAWVNEQVFELNKEVEEKVNKQMKEVEIEYYDPKNKDTTISS